MKDIAGYILSGGKAKRFNGRNKIMMKWEGKTFGEHLFQSLDRLRNVYISVATKPENTSGEVSYVEDIYQNAGPAGGILSGLIQCPQEALFVVPCDTPGIDRKLVDSMLNKYEKYGTPIFLRLDKKIQPLPAIYTKDMCPVLERMIQSGEYKLRSFFNMEEMVSYHVIDFRQNEIYLYNINSETDYRKLMEKTNCEGGNYKMNKTV